MYDCWLSWEEQCDLIQCDKYFVSASYVQLAGDLAERALVKGAGSGADCWPRPRPLVTQSLCLWFLICKMGTVESVKG